MFCFKEACATPSFPHGYLVTTEHQRIYKAGDVSTFICGEGFTAKSNLTTCTTSKEWNPKPACQPIVCNDTTEVINDAVIAYPSIGPGQTGNVSYNTTHFFLERGSQEVECRANMKLSWKERPMFGTVTALFSSYINNNFDIGNGKDFISHRLRAIWKIWGDSLLLKAAACLLGSFYFIKTFFCNYVCPLLIVLRDKAVLFV